MSVICIHVSVRPGPADADCDSACFLWGDRAVAGFACSQVALCALAAWSVHRCIHALSGPGLLAQTATALVSSGEAVRLPVLRAACGLVRPGSSVCASLHPGAARPGPAGAGCDSACFPWGNSAVAGFACLRVASCVLTALSVHRCTHVLSGPGLLAQTATALVSLGGKQCWCRSCVPGSYRDVPHCALSGPWAA
jgi:hypothetical protein